MPLSTWSVEKFVSKAHGDTRANNPLDYALRFEAIAAIQYAVLSNFYALLKGAYHTSLQFIENTSGIYGSGSLAAGVLTLSTRSADFQLTDVGKLVVIRAGSVFAAATIIRWVSASAVQVVGSGMPADGTINEAMMLSSTPSVDYIDLAQLKPAMMRAGAETSVDLVSTVTTATDALSNEEMRTWRSSAALNQNKIVYALSGTRLMLAKGSGLTSYGTLRLDYCRVPLDPTSDNDLIDVPEGAAFTLALALYKKAIGPKELIKDYMAEAQGAIQALYQSFGASANMTEIKKKVEALV